MICIFRYIAFGGIYTSFFLITIHIIETWSLFQKSPYWKKVWLKNMQKFVISGSVSIEDTMIRVHNSPDAKAPYVWIADRQVQTLTFIHFPDLPVCQTGNVFLQGSHWSVFWKPVNFFKEILIGFRKKFKKNVIPAKFLRKL